MPEMLLSRISIDGVLWFTLTIVIYGLFVILRAYTGWDRVLQPLLWGAGLIMVIIVFSGTETATYMVGGDWLLWMLAPVTIAIAVPIYEARHVIKQAFFGFGVALLVGSSVAVFSALVVVFLVELPKPYLLSFATKSITAPIAMGVASEINALPKLAMAIVIITGNIGILSAPWLFQRFKLTDLRAQGIALGVAAHGIGTAEALRQSALMGSFAGLAMGVNGVLTALVLPAIFN